jgi:hypothetical protein
MRSRVAMLMVALYAVCVAAPPAALALSGGAFSSHCISKESKGAAILHHHDDTDLSEENNQVAHHDEGTEEHGNSTKHKQSKICCGISCMSAIPSNFHVATLGELIVVKLHPSDQRIIVGLQPDFLNRPPIAL